jgi:hypothetical protein
VIQLYHGGTSEGPNDCPFEAGAPEFAIDLDAIVNTGRRGVRYNAPSSKLARRFSRVVPHPEAGASVLGTITLFRTGVS